MISPEAYAAVAQGDTTGFKTEGDPVELGKAWHAISFLVTGRPEFAFLADGVQLPEVSAHCESHSPEFIAELSSRLRATPAGVIMSRFDPLSLNENNIYPGHWKTPEADYVRPFLESFVSMVRGAADERMGLFVVIV